MNGDRQGAVSAEDATAAIIGTWSLTIRTPIGSIAADVIFEAEDGCLSGVAVGTQETVDLEDIVVDPLPENAVRVRWSQRITRPMRLGLAFDVEVTGDALQGVSRAGRLPSSKVSGHRKEPRNAD